MDSSELTVAWSVPESWVTVYPPPLIVRSVCWWAPSLHCPEALPPDNAFNLCCSMVWLLCLLGVAQSCPLPLHNLCSRQPRGLSDARCRTPSPMGHLHVWQCVWDPPFFLGCCVPCSMNRSLSWWFETEENLRFITPGPVWNILILLVYLVLSRRSGRNSKVNLLI